MVLKQKYKNLNIKKNYNPLNNYKKEVIKYFRLENKKSKYNEIDNSLFHKYLNDNVFLQKQNISNDYYFNRVFNFKNNQPLNYNNIIYVDIRSKNIRLSLLRKDGTPIITYSTGNFGFKKSDRKGIYSAKKLIINFLKSKEVKNIGKFYIYIKGFGIHRQFFFKKFYKIKRFKQNCTAIFDITTLPFNGCRGRKFRRI
jgi:ribosomal protein S11